MGAGGKGTTVRGVGRDGDKHGGDSTVEAKFWNFASEEKERRRKKEDPFLAHTYGKIGK